MSSSTYCTVIIPTLALMERADCMRRAIDSLREDPEAPLIAIVVNGGRFDSMLVDELSSEPGVEVYQIDTPSLPAALLEGRRRVKTPYFGFLDDDDQYIAGTISARLEILQNKPDVDVVVSNGFRQIAGTDKLAFRFSDKLSKDPLKELFSGNWLASCGGLFRANTVPEAFFEDIPSYLEWTWLAFRLGVSDKKFAFFDTPTFRIYDTEGSASKSDSYTLNQAEILQRMLAMTVRQDIQCILKRRISQAWHNVSALHLKNGDIDAAWRAHWRSVSHMSGWKYMPYIRHLIAYKGAPADGGCP